MFARVSPQQEIAPEQYNAPHGVFQLYSSSSIAFKRFRARLAS